MVFDEASAIPDGIWEVTEGALTGDDRKEAAENEEAARLWLERLEVDGFPPFASHSRALAALALGAATLRRRTP